VLIGAAAMFDGARPESHFLPREFLGEFLLPFNLYLWYQQQIEPPAELVNQIFPWVEDKLATPDARERENAFARDITLHQLFKLLIWFRTLLFQDGALLYTKYPQAPLWQYPP
jgi:hypothetical protein